MEYSKSQGSGATIPPFLCRVGGRLGATLRSRKMETQEIHKLLGMFVDQHIYLAKAAIGELMN